MKAFQLFRFVKLPVIIALVCSGCNKSGSDAPQVATNSPATVTESKTTNVAEVPTPGTNKPPVIISAAEARNHVGEMAVVTGKVFDVFVSQKGDTFVHIGGMFPKQPFTAVGFQGTIPSDDLKKFKGKDVKVTGKIKDYNGQIEIVLDHAEQISE